MSLWDRRFFGLTLATKVDLFLREIQAIMKIYPGTSYWDAYLLPVPVRKWLIEEHVKQQTDQSTAANTPLSPAEKQKFMNRPAARSTTQKR